MVDVPVKMHNAIFECAGCGEVWNTEKKTPIAIIKLIGIKPSALKGAKEGDYDKVYNTAFVDEDCFQELELEDKPPVDVVIPK